MPTKLDLPGKNAARAKSHLRRRRGVAGVGIERSPSIKSILVPIDFSAQSEKALPYAVAFARRFGARLTLLHVVEPIATPDFAASFPLALQNEARMKEAREHLKRVVEDLRLDPKLVERTAVRYGRAFDEVAGAARALDTDLIVISTHGYTGLKHALLGSITERVVQHAPCPVLVVRPCEHEFLSKQQKAKERLV